MSASAQKWCTHARAPTCSDRLEKNLWVHGSSSGQLTVTDTIGEIQMLSMVMNN